MELPKVYAKFFYQAQQKVQKKLQKESPRRNHGNPRVAPYFLVQFFNLFINVINSLTNGQQLLIDQLPSCLENGEFLNENPVLHEKRCMIQAFNDSPMMFGGGGAYHLRCQGLQQLEGF